jgi:hypothetical protein
MTREQKRLADYLAHIIEAIERIDRYTGNMDDAPVLEFVREKWNPVFPKRQTITREARVCLVQCEPDRL